jgi:hypothetical protein
MTRPNEKERERVLEDIFSLREQIWETKSYISSDMCKQYPEMYAKINNLEQQIQELYRKLDKNECSR